MVQSPMSESKPRPEAAQVSAPKTRLDNYHTQSKARAGSDKRISVAKLEDLLAIVRKHLTPETTYAWDANINGVVIRYEGNSRHQYEFWVENWWPAPNDGSVKPHGFLYSVNGVADMEPFAYYCPERDTAVFVNTEYYGQCKSWALGIAAVILERNFNTHSIHGACAQVGEKGVVIIAPTGTGKTTQVNKLLQHPQGKVVGDDWIYIRHPPTPSEFPLVVNQPERRLYVRTENALEEEWLRPVFARCKLENVVEDPADCYHKEGETCGFRMGYDHCLWGFANARAILPRDWMKGPEKVADTAPLNLIVLLRRDNESPAEVELSADEAIQVLREGKTMIRPGAGPKEKWGTYGYEPWYNPYLLAPDHARQERFFRGAMRNAKCVIINTGAPGESIARTYERILARLADV